MIQPPIEQMRQALCYDSLTGCLRWTDRAWYGRRAGCIAGNVGTQGYRVIKLGGKTWQGHRIAWLLAHGAWPSGEIDHINGDRSDNRISNLRVVTGAINSQNRRSAQRNNALGTMGVRFIAARHKFNARITVNGKTTSLGYFETETEARAAYVEAKRRKHEGCTL